MSYSESFKGLHYPNTVFEAGIIAREFKGWGYSEIMSLTPREREHWLKWAEYLGNQERMAKNNG